MPGDEFVAHCLELLASIGRPRAQRMFGGQGLYVDDLFLSLILSERLYLKVDDETRARFVAEGCEPFVYEAKGRSMSISYYTAPEGAIESPAQMQPWAQLALGAALRARAAKAASTRPKPSAARPKAPARASKAPAAASAKKRTR